MKEGSLGETITIIEEGWALQVEEEGGGMRK
jgi:hypothetical protein